MVVIQSKGLESETQCRTEAERTHAQPDPELLSLKYSSGGAQKTNLICSIMVVSE